MDTCVPIQATYPGYLVVFEVVEERRASNVKVGELEERLPDVRHGDLHGKMKCWIDQIHVLPEKRDVV